MTLLHGFRPETIESGSLGFPLTYYTHERTGLRVSYLALPGRVRKYAGILVPYGANFLRFSCPGEEPITVPAGSAHYLEHCIFTKGEDGGLMGAFSRLGAEVNAFTANRYTQFYFTATEHFEEGLRLYLKALLFQRPDATRVEAERGIILAEYCMYCDDPDSVCYQALMEQLFEKHPQRLDILGTEESIQAICAEDLCRITERFYTPQCLELSLAGDLEPERFLAAIDEELQALPDKEQSHGLPVVEEVEDKPQCLGVGRVLTGEVGMESFLIGIRDPYDWDLPEPPDARARLRRLNIARLMIEALLGDTSPYYQDLVRRGLLNESFFTQYVCDPGCSFWVIGGESRHPEEAIEALRDLLRRAVSDGLIDAELCQLEQRSRLGRFLMSLDSSGGCGSEQLYARLNGLHLPDLCEVLNEFVFEPKQILACFENPDLYTIVQMNRR